MGKRKGAGNINNEWAQVEEDRRQEDAATARSAEHEQKRKEEEQKRDEPHFCKLADWIEANRHLPQDKWDWSSHPSKYKNNMMEPAKKKE